MVEEKEGGGEWCDINVGGRDSPWAGPGEERPPLGRSVQEKRRVQVSLETEGKLAAL